MTYLKHVFSFFVMGLFAYPLSAQKIVFTAGQADSIIQGSELIRYDQKRQLPTYVSFSEKSAWSKSEFFSRLKKELELDAGYSFKAANESRDELGQLHTSYKQFYNQVELVYSALKTHAKQGKIHAFNGNFSKVTPEVNAAALSKEEAFEEALKFVGANEYYGDRNNFYSYNSPDTNGELVYLPKFIFEKNKANQLLLSYRFNLYAKSPFSRTLVFVNAQNGQIEFSESLIHTGNSEGTAVTAYSDTQRITTDSLNAVFRLRDSSRGDGIFTLNAQQTRNFSSAIDFIDSNNFWNNVNPNLDQYATDAHWGSIRFYDYLDSVFNRNSLNDSGFALTSYVHVDVNLVNAFWDGTFAAYGDGDQMRGPLTTLDIVGHELTHGLTDFSSDLIYANESGALNESFSDIFGTTLEFFARPNRANWEIGEDIGGAFRSMSNPKTFGSPDTYKGQNWINQNCIATRSNDQCGVHTNSGVQNHWFYLLSEGGSGVNDVADSFNVNGIGMKKAEKVAFRNLTVYLTPSSHHEDARFFAIVSAIDLFGACSFEVEEVTNAWHAVGVGEAYQAGVSADFDALLDTAFCSFPVDVSFSSTGSNVQTFRWDFGNGDSSNLRNPVIRYDSLGNFDVKLIADGGTCGSDTITKSNYIRVDTNIACAYFLRDTMNPVVSECRGRLLDAGGLNQNYALDENGVFTLSIPSADFIQLDFSKMDVESGDGFSCNKDFIEVFDGGEVSDKSMGRFCANHLPPNNRLVSSSNQLTIVFRSDRLNSASGFIIEWQCQSATQSPVADFTVSADSSCNGNFKFYNQSSNGITRTEWFFGDGESSLETNPSHLYKQNGDFNVKIVVENSLGKDSITKNALVHVNRPASPLGKNDTVCLRENAGFKINTSERIAWYRDTNQAAVAFGDSITLFNLQKDSTLFFKELENVSSVVGGKSNNAGAGNFSAGNDYISFDVHQEVILESFLLFPNRSGNRLIDIRNNKGEIVVSKSIFIPSSPLLVNVNIKLQPDTAYRISVSDRDAGLFKNTAGATFPYQISDLLTLRSSNLPSGGYPYFYRWSVRPVSCESNFSSLTAVVDTSCIITSIEEHSVGQEGSLSIYPNPSSDHFLISFSDFQLEKPISLNIYSAQGHLVMSKSNLSVSGSRKELKIDLSAYPAGFYFLELKGGDFLRTEKLIKSN